MFPIILLALLLSSGVIECGRRPTDPHTLVACSSRAETAAASQHSGGQASEGPERTRVQHLAQHLEQQSQPGNATQQALEAAAQTELVALNNRMELRRSEEQFRRIAALQPP